MHAEDKRDHDQNEEELIEHNNIRKSAIVL